VLASELGPEARLVIDEAASGVSVVEQPLCPPQGLATAVMIVLVVTVATTSASDAFETEEPT
jgi:hypothetical protein